MKKVLLVVLILALSATPLLFAACSSVSQRDLLTTGYVCSKGGYEYFAYDVFKADDDGYYTIPVGTMTMKFEPMEDCAVTLPDAGAEGGEKSIEHFTGTLLSTDVTMDNGDTILSRVVYDSGCVPTYSYKRTFIGGVTKEMQVSYEEKYLYADRYEEGSKVSSVEHKKANCYDNESLYAIVRASSVSASSYTLTFTAVNPLTGSVNGMTISKEGTTDNTVALLTPSEYTLPEGKEKYTTPTYVFSIATDNQYASKYYMEVTANAQTVKNETINIKNVKKIITSIIEGQYKYVLTDVKIV